MVHLGIRIARKYMSHLGRETFLTPVHWDDEGWPVVNGGQYVDTVMSGPLPPACPVEGDMGLDHLTRMRSVHAGLPCVRRCPGRIAAFRSAEAG
jgi:hypothetical protein